ncbi:hypothetical protein J4772_09375 [Cohnella sp. LGH]|uniref:hypothetical protein n=1 Tax=Cohnella sp. LGH TaxID=1619153 RepID=UPI001ADB5F74|nr:hypothetical protein [Cohnella sp. LGH]QTH44580.1 hypothetical protein J4772_09375 [Cohnella sp. LGH]
MNALTIKSIGDCTLAEITELWNVGFQQYLNEKYDRAGEVVGYALFSRSVNDEGLLCGVAMTHCEANPAREDGRDVVRFMLGEVYGPYDAPIERMAHYLRSTNEAAMEALAEAGFEKVFEEYLMVFGFGAQSGRTPQ